MVEKDRTSKDAGAGGETAGGSANAGGSTAGRDATRDGAGAIGPIHDAFFKRFLGEPTAMGHFLRERLPGEISALLAPEEPRLVPGSFVDDRLCEHLTDLVYRVPLVTGDDVFLFALIDHKSAPDPATPLQLGRYMMQLWDRLLREGAGPPLPRILPMVVYHGQRPWRVPLRFSGLCQAAPDLLAPYLPDFAYHLVDLGQIPDESLSGEHRLRAFLTVLKHIQRPDFLDHAPHILSALRHLEAMDIVTILSYIIMRWRKRLDAETIEGYVNDIASQSKDEIMGDVIDTWIAQGEAKGMAKGMAKGVAKGRAEGRTESLIRLLTRRFGPVPKPVEDRIAAADIETLDRWFDRAIDAPSLDAVFEAPSSH